MARYLHLWIDVKLINAIVGSQLFIFYKRNPIKIRIDF